MNKLAAFTVLYNVMREVYCDWEIEIGDCSECEHSGKWEEGEECLSMDCVEALTRSIWQKLESRGLMLEEGKGESSNE